MVIAGITFVLGTRSIVLDIISSVGRMRSWLAEQHTAMCRRDWLFILAPKTGVIS